MATIIPATPEYDPTSANATTGVLFLSSVVPIATKYYCTTQEELVPCSTNSLDFPDQVIIRSQNSR